ncbi:MAG: D-glycerate dehydrogenase [Chloroflexi bacterium]|nr:D-glycerate dehydrogenase [Chloroflexota bacterium]
MSPSVFVTRNIPEKGLEIVRTSAHVEVWPGEEPPPYDTLLAKARKADGLLTMLTDRVDAALMDAAPRLKVISNYAVGYDNIDVAAATARRIVVANTPGVLTETTADLAFALLLAAARRVVEGDKYVRAGKWRTWHPTLLLGWDVHHATLGLVGLGRIGAEVARRARGFSMRVLYHQRHRDEALERELGLEFAPVLSQLLAEADYVSLHVPLTPETRHLIGAAQLAQMKPTAILINTSRGPVVDEGALYEALASGIITYAALDVMEIEPIPLDSPLLALDNVVIAPHIGSASVATRTKMAIMAATNLVNALRGEKPAHVVNTELFG